MVDNLAKVSGWLSAQGIKPAGAPFFKYNVVDMQRELEVEAGIPVGAVVDDDKPVFAGVLPGGRFVTATHIGHPKALMDATTELLNWAAKRDLRWDAEGDTWGCRLEIYLTDPEEEPDMHKWHTELAFRLAD